MDKNPANMTIHIASDAEQLAKDAAHFVNEVGTEHIAQNNVFTIALSGGSTPALLYRNLADYFRDALDWSRVHFFWSDERFVPKEDPDSNYRTAFLNLLRPLSIAESQIHRVVTESDSAEQAAQAYEREIEKFFADNNLQPGRFDLVMLGLGDDGHTASLFPGTEALMAADKWVCANWVEKLGTWRITFTYPLIDRSENVLFLVVGGKKAGIVRSVLRERNPVYPAVRILQSKGSVFCYLDAAAAGQI